MRNRAVAHDLKGLMRVQRTHVAELVAMREEKHIPYEVFEVTKFLLEENIDLYGSILKLWRAGYFVSCLMLGRVLMENCINLQYIYQKDTERRAKNYMMHSFVAMFKRMKEGGVGEFNGEPVDERIKDLKQEFEKSGGNSSRWDGRTFKEMCEELGHTKIYNDFYVRLSQYTHSQYKGQRSFEESRPYNDFMRTLILRHIPILNYEALKAINEKYDLLWGVAIIRGYPYEGATLAFSFSSKKVDEEMGKR
jgi:hypothetical protein